MEDKEIIKTDCEYFKINRGFNCYKGHNCTDKECSDCYYKQLKRLQQDYVRLGKAFEHLKTSYQDSCEYILQLRAESERLKEEVKLFQYAHDNEQERRRKFGDCLQEIKDYLNTLSGIDNDFVNTETYLRILDCITKAESEG